MWEGEEDGGNGERREMGERRGWRKEREMRLRGDMEMAERGRRRWRRWRKGERGYERAWKRGYE